MDGASLPDRVAEDRPEWTTTFARGDVLARAGAWAEALYVIRSGRVGLWAQSDGPDTPTRVVGPGEGIGLSAVLTSGASGWTAEALEPTEALRIPPDAVGELAAAAPDLLLALTAGLAREFRAAIALARSPSVAAGEGAPEESDGTTASPPKGAPAPKGAPTPKGAPAPIDAAVVAPSLARPPEVEEPPDEESGLRPLYIEEVVCPVCETRFQATRVRIRALNAIRRETDLHTVYDGLSPLHYAVDVCPTCAYASSPDDWADCDDRLLAALEEDRADRLQAAGSFRFSGERTPQAGIVSTLLSLRCYDLRGIDLRRRATILHRLAWMSRETGDEAQEQVYLTATREAYERVYREDLSLNEAGAVRVSFLLGELAFRLGDPREAIRWFERTVRSEGIGDHPDLQRLAHDRWIDARESMRRSA